MKNKYFVCIQGCDDHTSFQIELTPEELYGVLKIASESHRASTYGCMPTINVYPEQDLSKANDLLDYENDYKKAHDLWDLPAPLLLNPEANEAR
jgi:hypothetical protein